MNHISTIKVAGNWTCEFLKSTIKAMPLIHRLIYSIIFLVSIAVVVYATVTADAFCCPVVISFGLLISGINMALLLAGIFSTLRSNPEIVFSGLLLLDHPIVVFFLSMAVISVITLALLKSKYRTKLTARYINRFIPCQIVASAFLAEYAGSKYSGSIWILGFGFTIQLFALIFLWNCYFLYSEIFNNLKDLRSSSLSTLNTLNNYRKVLDNGLKSIPIDSNIENLEQQGMYNLEAIRAFPTRYQYLTLDVKNTISIIDRLYLHINLCDILYYGYGNSSNSLSGRIGKHAIDARKLMKDTVESGLTEPIPKVE